MKYITLKNSGMKLSVVSLGTWAFGGGDYWANKKDDTQSFHTIDLALELGINLFDSAESYNNGESERLLGKAMQGRRSQFIVSTKVYLDKLGEKELIASCEESLKRMGTDYIDLFSPHFASKEIPFEETFGAMEKLKAQGKIRSIGISNFGIESIRKLEQLGIISQIELNQLPYSLLWRAIEFGIQQETAKHGMGILCYSTLAQGLLSGAYDSAAQAPDNLKVLRLFQPGADVLLFEALRELKALCNKENIELVPAALAWLFAQPAVASILTGATTPQLLRENLKCLDVELPPEIAKKMSLLTQPLKEKLGANADMWAAGADSRIY